MLSTRERQPWPVLHIGPVRNVWMPCWAAGRLQAGCPPILLWGWGGGAVEGRLAFAGSLGCVFAYGSYLPRWDNATKNNRISSASSATGSSAARAHPFRAYRALHCFRSAVWLHACRSGRVMHGHTRRGVACESASRIWSATNAPAMKARHSLTRTEIPSRYGFSVARFLVLFFETWNREPERTSYFFSLPAEPPATGSH